MANSNRVFVSPGIYTKETDLTFVAQSVGITTLGMAGETLKGPAFEPILIGSFDDFRNYFGTTSPEKYSDGDPKYELPYFAKSYLQQSNQLFITRVLGLTGYRPKYSWVLRTLPGVFLTQSAGTITSTAIGLNSGTTYVYSGATSTEFNQILPGNITIANYILNFANTNKGNLNNLFVKIGYPSVLTNTATGKTETDAFGSSVQWVNTLFSGATPVVNAYIVEYNEVATGLTMNIQRETFNGAFYTEYDNLAVVTLRSRGKYVNNTLALKITGNTTNDLTLVDATSALASNPFADFVLSAQTLNKKFTCNLNDNSTKFISKVLGDQPFNKNNDDFPIYVGGDYTGWLNNSWNQGYVRGLYSTMNVADEGTNYVTQWQTATSPFIVSEVRGSQVAPLYRYITVSDGHASNIAIKISHANIDLNTLEFDVLVRDFNDTDDNPIVLEKFSRCTMNPELPGYIGKKIGTNDGQYELKSKNVFIELVDGHPTDAVPAGFYGFPYRKVGTTRVGAVTYKTVYNVAGDVVGSDPSGVVTTSAGDKLRKSYLGLSSQYPVDNSLFNYKGLIVQGNTKGFHLSQNASGITDASGTTIFVTTAMNFENSGGSFSDINACKFTVQCYGGFDGWDIYRTVRTNTDGYILGKTTYTTGTTTNGGVFNAQVGNSDYYAYLQGIQTFKNPEAVNINVFATPGINFFDNSSLVSETIDMIEVDRADALYVVNSPNRDTNAETIEDLDSVAIDSSYSATYFPWIQVRDVDNSAQLFLPPTGEVLKNIALTDNIAYPWFAPAGYNRGLVTAIKAKIKLTLDDRDALYKARINPIATFSDVGAVIWGNKTLQVRESALDRVNVRRLLLQARKLISAVALKLLFDQDDTQVKNDFERLVNPILQNIKTERGLTDFRVVVEQTPEDIDANTLRGKIYIKPSRSLEFIDVNFIVTPTGASFDNV